MPLFDFECTECGARAERLVSAGSDAVDCERCGARAKRLLPVIAGLGGRTADPAPTCGAGACGNC
ncbi:MAG TPA: FmdB family zinc ribbon protein [Actinomycetota bacterium]|nr:FmdB family zinc ribbon protein [Actinomycetota bacterium]